MTCLFEFDDEFLRNYFDQNACFYWTTLIIRQVIILFPIVEFANIKVKRIHYEWFLILSKTKTLSKLSLLLFRFRILLTELSSKYKERKRKGLHFKNRNFHFPFKPRGSMSFQYLAFHTVQ